ncbi:MAG: DNA repair protein RecO [Planctomycetaceae bacterium]|nr:DNA repair protein RecO [Planctomycetaceae bacterium]
MPAEKTDAIVIRLADFSESSKVVTLFTREFGKVAGLAKGAKRLKSPFEAALDLLTESRIVFLRKATSGLDLLTEAQLISRFRPAGGDLARLYSGYYIAELLDGLTQEYDPHPRLYDAASGTLRSLSGDADPRLTLLHFELELLQEIGHLPDFEACSLCHEPVEFGQGARFWVSQGGLICPQCGRPEYQHTEVQGGTIAVLQRLAADEHWQRLSVSAQQFKELRRIVTAAICFVLERKPRMLKYLPF